MAHCLFRETLPVLEGDPLQCPSLWMCRARDLVFGVLSW